ncbi:MAG: FitA-like ribbon-helix-helix domain-containing protein [Alphaproteobacteria bacterium]
MAQLTIRKLDDDLVRRLKIRAAENGRSAEAEVRAILKAAILPGAADLAARSRRLRTALAKTYAGDSTALLRETRDRDTQERDTRDRDTRDQGS